MTLLIAERFRQSRERVGLTQAQLADALGGRYAQQTVSQVENGRKGLLFDGVVRAAQRLHVSIDYLAGLSDDPKPAKELEEALRRTEAELERLRAAIGGQGGLAGDETRADRDALPFPAPASDPDVSFVPRLDVQAAAGHGAIVHDETVTGAFAFRRDWLDQRGIDPAQASLVEVLGRSMEPELAEGSTVLVDHKRRRCLVGHMFVVRTDAGVVVKRAGKDEGGRWLMLSDNEDQKTYPPVPWTREDRVIGEVRWVGTVVP